MPKDRGRGRETAHRQPRWRQWNRGDFAILLSGVLAFLTITFGLPLLAAGGHADGGKGTGVEATAPAIASTLTPAAPPATPGTDSGLAADGGPVAVAESTLPRAAPPVRIRYPAAAFDVPVHALDLDAAAEASQIIVPPATKDGYWLTPFGTAGSGSANTTYVVGHSWEGADAPFNRLSSAAAAGDHFDVDTFNGTITYRVDSVTTYLKSTLKDSPIWEIVPNRLVLISCYTEDPWGRNVVVTASPATT